MSAREELARIIGGKLITRSSMTETADAILAAGYRKPQQVTTVEELDALPVGSVVLDRTGDTARRFPGGWRTTVAEPDGSGWLSACMEDADLPATVLHVGSAES